MKILSFLSFLCLPLIFLAAGCTKNDSSAPSSNAPVMNIGSNVGAPTVPDDIFVHPQGTVIASTGYGNSHTVAQLTTVSTDTLLEWVKKEYPKKGLTLKNTSVEGGSTTFIFENAERKYTVRIDRPLDNQGSALTVIREGK